MHLDVTDLRDFYARPLGLMVRRLLAHRIRARWRRVSGETLIGLGFATPYLNSFRGEAFRIGALMPAAQGALVWPQAGDKMTVLVDEDQLPLPDNSVDRLLVVHCLETAERVRPLLREMWRILAPQGRVLMLVPNRRSIWARSDRTPFGHGRPYSRNQLERLLKENLFTPIEWSMALHVPPLEWRMVMRSATVFERLGAGSSSAFGGVILVEARKELAAPALQAPRARALGRLVPATGQHATRDLEWSGEEHPVRSLPRLSTWTGGAARTPPSRQARSARSAARGARAGARRN
jgi:SAM-dependent methyltransferase